MPSFEHEALLQLFRNEPSLAPHLLRSAFGVVLPDGAAAAAEGNLTQIVPTEYRADLVVALGSGDRVVVEVQLGRDERKRWTWPRSAHASAVPSTCWS